MAVYIFLDESGNLDFSARGSRFFCFGTLTVRDPAPVAKALTGLRYELMASGLELECFHASEDRQAVRDRVFSALREVDDFDLDFVVADKFAAPEQHREAFAFYAYLGYGLIDRVLARLGDVDDRIVLVTDTLPLHRDRKALAKAFRTAIRETLGDRPFSLVHHASAAHAGLQGADYATWAVQRKWQRGDQRSYLLIRDWIRSETEAFGGGRWAKK